MKIYLSLFTLLMVLITLGVDLPSMTPKNDRSDTSAAKDSALRHVVLFKFKEGTTANQLEVIESAFVDLKHKIPEIESLEWGLNNSPEDLAKGFTHCFFLTFATEAARDVYLPHPDHKAFGALLDPYLEDVLVIDYWTP